MADILDITGPQLGVVRSLGYQSGPDFAAYDALNVRGVDVFERRRRNGSRPGLAKAFATDAGTGAPVRLLNSLLTGQEVTPPSTFEDDFDDSLSADWGAVWLYDSDAVLPRVVSGRAITSSSDELCGAFLDLKDYNTSAAIEIETKLWADNVSSVFSSSHATALSGSRWRIGFGLSGSTARYPHFYVFGDGTGSPEVGLYDASGTLVWSSSSSAHGGNVLRLRILPGGVVQIYLGTTSNLVATVSGVTLSSKRVGFFLDRNARDIGLEYFNFSYTPVATATPIAEPAIVKSVSGSLYYESAGSTITEVTGQNVDLASGRLLSSAERFGKLYIADYEVIAEGTDGVTAGSGTAPTFDSATYRDSGDNDPNWDDDSDVTTSHRIELMAGGSGTYTPGVYVIASVPNNAPLTLTSPTSLASQSGSAIPFRILRPLKVFDYRLSGANKLTNLTRKSGTDINPPIGCTLSAIWLDRLVLSGDPENPGDTFMSRQGDPTDWEEDTSDTSPVYGEFDTNTRIDEPVTALIPFTLDYLVFGALASIHVLRGNPVRGGTVDAVSRSVGVIDKQAWCITPDGYLVVLTGDGLYLIDPMASSARPLSRDRLPKDFIGFDTSNNDIQLAFDVDRNGICIAVTPKTEGTGTFYWFDWTNKAFWPEGFHVDHHPTAMTVYVGPGDSTPKLVFGSRDGYLRNFLDGQYTDDGKAFESYVLIGPIQLGGNGYLAGMLRELVCQLATAGASARLQFQVGDSIESAYRANPRPSIPIILRPGKGLSHFPRLRGNACFIRVSGMAGEAWAMEQLTLIRERLGKQRLLT